MGAVLGIDVGKAECHAMLLVGERRMRMQFANKPAGYGRLALFLRKRHEGAVSVCMEATGTYHLGVATRLHSMGHRVAVINPASIKHFAASQLKRTKTDQVDAELIAEFGQRMETRQWSPAAPELRELQALVRHRTALVEVAKEYANRLEAPETPASVVRSLRKMHRATEKEIAAVAAQIHAHLNAHAQLKAQSVLLTSIDGIGEVTAACILGECQGIERFETGKQLDAYAGLAPRQNTSGSSVHGKPRLSKTGNPHLRRGIYMAAVVARNHNPLLKEFADRLEAAGKPKMAVLGAVMRKLLRLSYGVLKSGVPFDPAHHQKHLDS